MENTLHHQLKELYREENSEIEVKLGRYRIDVVNGKRLVEIQRSGLSSIRRKIKHLCEEGYLVDVVKPVVARKRIIKLTRKNGRVSDSRWSPKRCDILAFFEELIYFTDVFPHPNLRMIVPLIAVEEVRYPGQGRKRWRRKSNFLVKDRKILEIHDSYEFSTVRHLQKLLPKLPKQWGTLELSEALSIRRHEAQKIAYVLRKTGTAKEIGKRGNAILCRLASAQEARDDLKQKQAAKRKSIREVRAFVESHQERMRRKTA